MYSLTPYALELGLKFLFTAESVTRPTSLFLARHIGTANDLGSLNEETTAADSSYARLPITFGASVWSSVLGIRRCLSTSSENLVPAVAAGTRSYYAWSIWDAATAGNCLCVIPFAGYTVNASNVSPRTIEVGSVIIGAGMEIPAVVGMSEHGLELFLNWLFTAETVVRPTTWKLSLHTASPSTTGSANELTVGVDANYVRKAVSFSAPVTTGDTEMLNSTAALWNPATGSVYDASHIGVNDGSTGSSLYTLGLVTPKSSIAPVSISEKELKIYGIE